MSQVESRLAELGLCLPPPPAPAGSYVPVVISGSLAFTSGQLPLQEGALQVKGKIGRDVSLEQGAELARVCVLNALAALRQALGDLDRVRQVVKLTGFVASAPGFTEQPKVVNGASDLLIRVFGERGRHARSAVGVAELPLCAPVEVELTVEIVSDG